MLLEVKDKHFLENLVIESKYKPVLLYFWSSNSRVSQVALYKIADIGKDLEDSAIIGLVNADKHKEIASMYDVKNIPTLLALKQGKPIDRFCGVGINNEDRLISFIESSQ